MNQQPKYRFYPTLLDSFQNYVDSDSIWDKYYGNSETPPVTMEEFHDQKLQDLLDSINRVEREPSEAAAKGTCLNEIVDRIIMKRNNPESEVIVKTVRDLESCKEAIEQRLIYLESSDEEIEQIATNRAKELLGMIRQAFIYASVDGFEFCFDINFCKEIAKYFDGCLCQYKTSAILPVSKGNVELYGYIDYLQERSIFDLKTTKNYAFGNYAKYNQRHAYPYCMEESGMMSEVRDFEFTAYQLSGGNSRTPLITGKQNKEVYTYSRSLSVEILTDNCERFIDFINDNIDKIDLSKTKIFKDRE